MLQHCCSIFFERASVLLRNEVQHFGASNQDPLQPASALISTKSLNIKTKSLISQCTTRGTSTSLCCAAA
jgi:hypothetical protein